MTLWPGSETYTKADSHIKRPINIDTWMKRHLSYHLAKSSRLNQHQKQLNIKSKQPRLIWHRNMKSSVKTSFVRKPSTTTNSTRKAKMHASMFRCTWRSNYREPPKNGSLKNGARLISEALWNNLSAVEMGRDLRWWCRCLDMWAQRGLHIRQLIDQLTRTFL